MNHQDQTWLNMWKNTSQEVRTKLTLWRKQNTITRISSPSRIPRARRLGYKSKNGIIVVRIRVSSGGMRKQRPKAGRRPKHLGVTRIKASINMRHVAENRVLKKYRNMTVLGSYFMYNDSKHYWYEIILTDLHQKTIIKDKDIKITSA